MVFFFSETHFRTSLDRAVSLVVLTAKYDDDNNDDNDNDNGKGDNVNNNDDDDDDDNDNCASSQIDW